MHPALSALGLFSLCLNTTPATRFHLVNCDFWSRSGRHCVWGGPGAPLLGRGLSAAPCWFSRAHRPASPLALGRGACPFPAPSMTGGAASVGTSVCPPFLQRPGPGPPRTHLLTDPRSSVTAGHSFTARREMRYTVQPTRPLLEPGRDRSRVCGPGEDLPGPGEDGGEGRGGAALPAAPGLLLLRPWPPPPPWATQLL